MNEECLICQASTGVSGNGNADGEDLRSKSISARHSSGPVKFIPLAVQGMKEIGIDLSHHYPKRI